MTSSILTGIMMANELKERTKTLKEIHQMAIHIKTDLEYRAPDICDCFRYRGKLFSRAYELITRDAYLPCEAVKKAATEIISLKKDDIEIINAYAENLNCEDIGGQIANVNWLIENTRKLISDAVTEYEAKSRLYRSGGVIAGFGFIILLL